MVHPSEQRDKISSPPAPSVQDVNHPLADVSTLYMLPARESLSSCPGCQVNCHGIAALVQVTYFIMPHSPNFYYNILLSLFHFIIIVNLYCASFIN